ncbi:MAG: cation diffusion facilitator family transporter [Verrucomicrobiales bacterium]
MSDSRPSHDHHSTGNLKVAFFLNLAFTILEIVGGLWTNSIAILTDAVHDLGDSVSLGLAWYFDKFSERSRTARHTYGFRRYRLLGGLVTGVVLLAGLGFVLSSAIGRLRSPEPVEATGMMALAVVGILLNGAAVLRVRRGSSLTEKIVSWHLVEDTLGWVAVLIGAAIMAVWDLPIIDPLLSIGISVVILWNVARNLKQVFLVFLQASPEGFDPAAFEKNAAVISGVASLHHIHSWSIDGEHHVLSAHVVLADAEADPSRVKEAIRNLLPPGEFEHVTIEIEQADETCGADRVESDSQPS